MINGYVKSKQPVWAHVLKRNVEPGGEIPLDALYAEYGKKHKLEEGKEFVEWLKGVKLKDSSKWQIVFIPDEEKKQEVVDEVIVSQDTTFTKISPDIVVNDDNITMAIKDMGVPDVVELSVRKAREVVPKIRDLNLLKYSLSEASQRANKDGLCNLIRKQIRDLEISR
jgi:hypothetical protein